jgi:predicted transcriptional regulator
MKDIKKLRLKKGMSQKELADKSGVQQCTISLIETGKIDPRNSTVEKIYTILK